MTLERIAAYVSGDPEAPNVLAGANALDRKQVLDDTQPILVPIEIIDQPEAIRRMPDDIRGKILSRRQAEADNSALLRFMRPQSAHPLGRGAVGLVPLTTETGKQLAFAVARAGAGIVVVIEGWLHGFLKSIADTATGLVHLAGSLIHLIIDAVRSVISRQLVGDVKELIGKIRAFSWADLSQALGEWAAGWDAQLKSKDPLVSLHALSYLVGYVMAEAAMLLLSGGALTELKGAFWATRLGQIVKESAALRTIEKGLAKVAEVQHALGTGLGKAAAALRRSRFEKLVRAAELAGTGITWTVAKVKWVLGLATLPADLAQYIAEYIVRNVRQLERFLPRIEMLSDRAKKWLLDCRSPCKRPPGDVVNTLEKTANEDIEAAADVQVPDEPVPDSSPSFTHISKPREQEFLRLMRKVEEDASQSVVADLAVLGDDASFDLVVSWTEHVLERTKSLRRTFREKFPEGDVMHYFLDRYEKKMADALAKRKYEIAHSSHPRMNPQLELETPEAPPHHRPMQLPRPRAGTRGTH
jgi:hypothetical protein